MKARCFYCGKQRRLQTDHVVPRSRGGEVLPNNTVRACGSCNQSKGSRLLLEWIFSGKSPFTPKVKPTPKMPPWVFRLRTVVAVEGQRQTLNCGHVRDLSFIDGRATAARAFCRECPPAYQWVFDKFSRAGAR